MRQLFPILNKSCTTDLALIICKSFPYSILSSASLAWVYAAKTELQAFQNEVLRIIIKLLRVTPIATLHEQTGMSLIRSHFKSAARALYQKSATSKISQIQEVGHYDLAADKHLCPILLFARQSILCSLYR
jgi:hypothetical protein